jgi:hypothetical protein
VRTRKEADHPDPDIEMAVANTPGTQRPLRALAGALLALARNELSDQKKEEPDGDRGRRAEDRAAGQRAG